MKWLMPAQSPQLWLTRHHNLMSIHIQGALENHSGGKSGFRYSPSGHCGWHISYTHILCRLVSLPSWSFKKCNLFQVEAVAAIILWCPSRRISKKIIPVSYDNTFQHAWLRTAESVNDKWCCDQNLSNRFCAHRHTTWLCWQICGRYSLLQVLNTG